ncbi:MAG: ABC transporter permease [Acidimicrobiales bacterium]
MAGTTDLVATLPVVRLVLRRDRIRVVVWVAAIVAMVAVSAGSVKGLFPTQADLDQAAAASDNPAIIVFNGPAQALDTMGGQVAFQVGAFGLMLAAVMGIMMTGRLTRGEEQSGRLELLRSLPLGRQAPTAAAMVVVGGMALATGALITASLLAMGLPVTGSVSFGLGYVLTVVLFGAIALAAAQLFDNTRAVYGWSLAVLGAAYGLRAVGDITGGGLTWLSPIGWMQKARPFAGDRWWPFLLAVLTIAALTVTAGSLLRRRDLGAGLLPDRPGPDRASARLRGPTALTVRLQRTSVLGWAAGALVAGGAYGLIAPTIETFVADNQAMADIMTGGLGGDLISTYLSQAVQVLGLLAGAATVQSVLHLRADERSTYTEAVLARPVSRWALVGGAIGVAAAVSIVILGVGALATGGGAAATLDDPDRTGQTLKAAAALLPAVWTTGAVAVLIIGVAPRWSVLTWAVVVWSFVVMMFGALLDLPGWLAALSPYDHVPLVPAESFRPLPVIALTAVAAGLSAVGTYGFRRRDLTN